MWFDSLLRSLQWSLLRPLQALPVPLPYTVHLQDLADGVAIGIGDATEPVTYSGHPAVVIQASEQSECCHHARSEENILQEEPSLAVIIWDTRS